MRNKKIVIIFILSIGMLVFFTIVSIINKSSYLIGIFTAVLIIELIFAGKLSAWLYFERIILKLLIEKDGEIDKESIIKHFRNSATSIEETDIESTVDSTIQKLERKGDISISINGDNIILNRN